MVPKIIPTFPVAERLPDSVLVVVVPRQGMDVSNITLLATLSLPYPTLLSVARRCHSAPPREGFFPDETIVGAPHHRQLQRSYNNNVGTTALTAYPAVPQPHPQDSILSGFFFR